MATLLDLVRDFDGVDAADSLRVPATRIAEFVVAASELGLKVGYLECLFVGPGFVRPSMEHSREKTDFSSDRDFIEFAKSAGRSAADEAVAEGSSAYFEIGVISAG